MTNAKLTTALSTLAQRAPGLLTSIETFSFAANTGILATFSLEGDGDGVISVQPELIDTDEQVYVDFALGVTAYNISNHIRERGTGRDSSCGASPPTSSPRPTSPNCSARTIAAPSWSAAWPHATPIWSGRA